MLFSLLSLLTCVASPADERSAIPITGRLFHLGDGAKPEWREFTTVEPIHGTHVEIEFLASQNKRKLTLEVHAGDVAEDWKVKVNGHEVGRLEKGGPLTRNYFQVPLDTLKDGRNRLLISSDKGGDDIYVGKAAIHHLPMGELLEHAQVRVLVRDAQSGQSLPSRLTITRFSRKKFKEKVKASEHGKPQEKDIEVERTVEELVEVLVQNEGDLAARKGVLYTRKGHAAFYVAPGEYTLYATRGFEYGVAAARLRLARREEREVELWIRREVDTTGFVAADTHIHTQTYSKHGDINLEERVITIAGEGVEVAVATDHNHHTDYAPVVEKVKPQADFQTVIGNEVTTSIGHFNAFPFQKETEPPDHSHTQWTRLVQAMRNSSGVRVVILNHPRRPQGSTSTLEQICLNPLSGEAHRGPEHLGVDAIEILNGRTLTDDRMMTLSDWFALLNRGYRMAAVAASDSHSVDQIVGQARTYVKSSTDDPRRIRIDEICESFLGGRLLPSLGLLTQVEVDGPYGVGDLVTPAGDTLKVKITVQAPSWIQANRVALYLNGLEARSERIGSTEKTVKFEGTWWIPAPPHDAHLVALASGPAVTALYWPISGGDTKYVMGAANPIWIDGDRDGQFTCAHEYAVRLVSAHGMGSEELKCALAGYDSAVAVQFASLFRARIERQAQEVYERLLEEADRQLAGLLGVNDPRLRRSFADYLRAAPKVDVQTRERREQEAKRLMKEEEERKKRNEARARKKKEEEEKKRKEDEEKREKERRRLEL